ncbi:MAG TPA: Ig-like domain-containing protein [Longimicrobium sp.]|jgi:uncharacterized protein YjdB
MKTMRLWILSAAVLAAAACGDTGTGSEPGNGGNNGGGNGPGPVKTVAEVVVTPDAPVLEVGAAQDLSATLKAADGTVLGGRTIAWESSDEAVAKVTSAGRVTALAEGTATITASSEGRAGRATLTVRPQPVATVTILPESPVALYEGGSMQLIAVPRAADGSDLNMRVPVWQSSDESVAWVSNTGGLVAGTAGTATITATVEGKSDTVTVRVLTLVRSVRVTPAAVELAVGGTASLGAAALDASGAPLGRTIAWASENASVATVDASGRVTARGVGTTEITATVSGVVGRATVRVLSQTVFRLESAEGRPVPARLYDRVIEDDDGVSHTLRVVATGGAIRILGSRWEQRLTLDTYEGGVLAWSRTFTDSGDLMYDAFTGEPMLVSTTYPGFVHRGSYSADGNRLTVRQKVDGDAPEISFVYARQ